MNHVLKQDIQLPRFSGKEWLRLLTLIILPNAIFLLLAWKTNTSRPLLNIDYLLAILLIFNNIKLLKYFGYLFFVCVCAIDILMFTVQIFPFLDIVAILYFIPFITLAPLPYLIGIAIGLIIMLILPFILLKIGKFSTIFYLRLICSVLIVFSLMFHQIRYAEFFGILGRNNYFVANSQIWLYHKLTQDKFVVAGKTKSKLTELPTGQQFASALLQQPNHQKILFIVAESWGALRQPEAFAEMVANISKQTDKLEFWQSGKFAVLTESSTLHGEMRELCQRNIRVGFGLAQVEEAQFADCLPNRMKQQGYQTIAVHGGSGQLYDLYAWYPKAGFQQTVFVENLLGLRRCVPLLGVCDSEISQKVIPEIFKKHQNDKIFFYWLTLTAHQPYAKKDIVNTRFNCVRYGLNETGEICRNFHLNTQLMDNIAELIQRDEMRGTEVIIVGDHAPPLLDGEDFKYQLYGNYVGWLHFKIRD